MKEPKNKEIKGENNGEKRWKPMGSKNRYKEKEDVI